MKKEYLNVNTNKLHDELISAGIVPLFVESLDNKTWITFEGDVDMTAVQKIIDEHDATPLSPQPTENEVLRDYILDVDFRLIMMELGL